MSPCHGTTQMNFFWVAPKVQCHYRKQVKRLFHLQVFD
jgi:hypothetical protein